MNPIRQFFNWYFSHRSMPYWCILAIDCMFVYFSGLVVYYLLHGGAEFAANFWGLSFSLVLCMTVFAVFFFIFHTYKGRLRYASFVDLSRVAYSTSSAAAVVFLFHVLHVNTGIFPNLFFPSVDGTFLAFAFSTMLMWTLRIAAKSLHDTYLVRDAAKNVFVYGCLSGGVTLAKSIISSVDGKYKLCGFISGDPDMEGSWMLGVPVFYDNDNVVQKMQDKGVTVLLVSPAQTERFTNRTSLIDALMDSGIQIMMMPHAEKWDGKSVFSHNQLKEVEIEDLLPRQKIEIDMEAIGAMLKGKRILMTGAAGSIGSELSRQVAKLTPAELILIDQAETPMHDVRLYMTNNHSDLHIETIVTSICREDRMESIFAQYRPEYVFHAAAYKHVPMMENNPAEAVQNNIYGTRVIADLAVKYGTKKFVMISTDKAVNPTNVMGCSKRICEIYCQSLNGHQQTTQFVTTRFGNVLGSNGSVIPIFREQIKNGGPVKVTHPDIIRYFMLIPEACRLVLEAGTMGKGGEIFVFDMGEPVKIVDLAKRMIALSGAKDVKIEFTGLRDGEKLFEELLATKENAKPTHHPKIMVAQVREYPFDLALQNEIELYELSKTFDDMAIVNKMKEIVPEFKSQNSKYQELDKKSRCTVRQSRWV